MIEEESLRAIRLGSLNVFSYLVERGICSANDRLASVDQLLGKNMNLLVHFARREAAGVAPDCVMVKQGPVGRSGIPKDGFEEEWLHSKLLSRHDELMPLRSFVSQPIAYDKENEILVCRFFQGYQDLGDFYGESKLFPPVIAAAMGATLALLHSSTFQRADYLHQLDPDLRCLDLANDQKPDYRNELRFLTPSIFERISVDGLKFYELYQSAPELSEAISSLEMDARRYCLIHGDMKFNNILLHHDWPRWKPCQLPSSPSSLQLADATGVLRVIDWEQWTWGDPAVDVGALLADYLRIWLRSLRLSRGVDLGVALKLAAVPLELIQPSLRALLEAYLAQFPLIIAHDPDFVDRIFQVTGLGLIRMIQAKLHYFEPFGTVEASMLQVAKSLLCEPHAAREMLLGRTSLGAAGFDPAGLIDQIQLRQEIPATVLQAEPHTPLPLWTSDFTPQRMLADLIENIRIDPPLIEHPAYQPLNLQSPDHSELGASGCGGFRGLPAELRCGFLLEEVKNYIYDIYFSGERERRGGLSENNKIVVNNSIAGMDLDFFTKLQNANAGTGFFDPDWDVVNVDAERLLIEKDGLQLWVDPNADLASGADLAPGSHACLKMPSALFAGQFYVAIGNAGEPLGDKSRLRIYFNVTADGALALMDLLSQELNAQSCRYAFKALHDPSAYGRYDSASVEIHADDYPLFCLILERYWPSHSLCQRAPVPLFSCPLAPGVGLVECPEDGADFGLSRCEVLAQALLKAQLPTHSRLQMIIDQFAQAGLDWSRPYLNPGSTISYAPLSLVSDHHDAGVLPLSPHKVD
jgi:hypothetical protein